MIDDLFLVATLAGRSVAIPSSLAESVIVLGAIVPVPGAPSYVMGLAALRSRVVTVIDAAARLGIARSSRTGDRAIVTMVDGHVYAAVVDDVEDVAALSRGPLPNGVHLSDGWRSVADGVAMRDGTPLLVVDLAALIRGHAQALAA